MLLMTTVVAVALGLAPIRQDGSIERSPDYYATAVGNFAQTIDGKGITHLRGFNRLNGDPYHLRLRADGRVEGEVGALYVTFRVREAA